MKIFLTGGGSGGHLMPLLAVMNEIRQLEPAAEFWFLGPESEFNGEVSAAGVRVKIVRSGKLRRYFDLKNVWDIFNLLLGVVQAMQLVWREKPAVIFSKGGFAGVPTVVAGKIWGVPIVLHESDTTAGLANRLMAQFAGKICVSFEGAAKVFPEHKVMVTGNPIRAELMSGERAAGLRFLGFRESKPVLLIFGGSQGAEKINQLAVEILPRLLEKFQVAHIAGKNQIDELEKTLGERENLKNFDRNGYKLLAFVGKEMKDVYAVTDLVVARAGANSLAEILALEKPALIVPLASAASNHQFHNAAYFARQNLILMVEEKHLNAEKFWEWILELEKRAAELKDNLRQYNAQLDTKTPEVKIAEEILRLVKRA